MLWLLSVVVLGCVGQVVGQWKEFLLANRLHQCQARPDQPRMPRSFYVHPGYFDTIPQNERIPPSHKNEPQYVAACGRVVDSAALDAYEFDTERYLCSIGLNIYDGAVWSIALALSQEADLAMQYEERIIDAAHTCQFSNLHADATCHGLLLKGTCNDPTHSGSCGFCYGSGTNQEMTLPRENAWIFRMLSDYWALEGTVDARCPEKGYVWTWNDYRPVLGENSWASLLAPMQVAYLKYGSTKAIPDSDISIRMALTYLPSLMKMMTSVGAVGYAPKNTLNMGKDFGYDVSTENNFSLLAGLKMLREILTKKGIHLDRMGDVNYLIDTITNYVKASYDPALGYFRQGGSFDMNSGQFVWASEPNFAVDCQTWGMSVVSPLLIDQWFGTGTSRNIWETTKRLGGYHCVSSYGNSTTTKATLSCDGLGFSYNSADQVFSGEWTLGGINMLRIFAKEYNDPSFSLEADRMLNAIKQQLVVYDVIDSVPVSGVLYANKRYFIPFGWWANPVLSTVSTAWTLLADQNFNPFFLGGAYTVNYP